MKAVMTPPMGPGLILASILPYIKYLFDTTKELMPYRGLPPRTGGFNVKTMLPFLKYTLPFSKEFKKLSSDLECLFFPLTY